MKWTNAEDIGIALAEKFPGVDPLTIRCHRICVNACSPLTASTTTQVVERTEARGDSNGLGTRSSRKVEHFPSGGCAAISCRSGAGMRARRAARVFLGSSSAVNRSLGSRRSGALGTWSGRDSRPFWRCVSLITRRTTARHPLLIVGLFALGIMFLSWRIIPQTAGDRALTISQAFAIVEGDADGFGAEGGGRRRHLSRNDCRVGAGGSSADSIVCQARRAQPYAVRGPKTTTFDPNHAVRRSRFDVRQCSVASDQRRTTPRERRTTSDAHLDCRRD
jgi:hypothetical protein